MTRSSVIETSSRQVIWVRWLGGTLEMGAHSR